MKFKAIVITLFISLNLNSNEILTNQQAVDKFSEYGQINRYPSNNIYDYKINTFIKPSFKCSKKFKKYSLEDFICNSNFNAFGDNYFASLYSIIIKENPNLKDKALKIARERIRETKKECMVFSTEVYDYCFEDRYADAIISTLGCILDMYSNNSSRLALMLYDNDKELFKKIFGEDYEKFKEAFEDTLKTGEKNYTSDEYRNMAKAFEDKYKDYNNLTDGYYIFDIIYILSIQYDLIDSTGKFK